MILNCSSQCPYKLRLLFQCFYHGFLSGWIRSLFQREYPLVYLQCSQCPHRCLLLQDHLFQRWEQCDIFTARKRSCGKLMFLHLSVILDTGEGSLSEGSLSEESLSGGLCLGRASVQGGSLLGRSPTVKSGQHASYWNAFLFCFSLLISYCPSNGIQ